MSTLYQQILKEELWNKDVPIGSTVRLWTGAVVQTISEAAYDCVTGMACVRVEGAVDPVPLEVLEVLSARAKSDDHLLIERMELSPEAPA